MTGAGRRRVRRYVQGPGSSRARRIVVRLWWRARASSRMLVPSRKWAYRIRSMSTTLINLSSSAAAASITGTVLMAGGSRWSSFSRSFRPWVGPFHAVTRTGSSTSLCGSRTRPANRRCCNPSSTRSRAGWSPPPRTSRCTRRSVAVAAAPRRGWYPGAWGSPKPVLAAPAVSRPYTARHSVRRIPCDPNARADRDALPDVVAAAPGPTG